MSANLFFHPESDSIFWSQEWPNDGLCEEVTHNKRFREAAKLRGIAEPRDAIPYDRMQDWEVTSAPKVEHTMASAIVQSQKVWDRKPADFYPTPVDATEAIIPLIRAMKNAAGEPVKRVWEPACGDGRMSRVLEWHGYDVVSTDYREHSGYGYGGLDFLTETPLTKWGWDLEPVDLIVSNPPFKLAEEFIKRALDLCPNVMMLLKSQYWHAASRHKLFGDRTPSVILPLTWRPAFLEEERGKSPLMDVIWCVWTQDHIAEDSKGRGYCVFEPVKRVKYPGHPGRGLSPTLRVLAGEIEALTGSITELTSKLKG